MLEWNLHNSSVLGDGALCLPLTERFAISQANFSTGATGGYLDGQITLEDVPEAVVMDAVQANWLMREVRASDGAGFQAYQGHVAEVEGHCGDMTFVRRVAPMFNRVRLEFWMAKSGKRVDAVRIVEDTASQQAYGVKETVLNLKNQGTMYEAQALSRGNEFLELSKVPQAFDSELGGKPQENVGGKTNSLRLTTWGRFATLQWRVINFAVKTQKELKSIFYTVGTNKSLFTLIGGAAVQFVNQSSLIGLQTTGISVVYNASNGITNPQDFVLGITKFGDANLRRAYFQLWEEGLPALAVRSTEPQVFARHDAAGRVWSQYGTPIPAYMVRAGGYEIVQSYAGSLADASGDVADDVRAKFIETTSYDDVAGTCQTEEPQADNLALLFGWVRGRRRFVNA